MWQHVLACNARGIGMANKLVTSGALVACLALSSTSALAINYDVEAHTGVTPNPRHLGEFNAVFVGGHVAAGTLDDLYVNTYFYDDGP